MAEGFTGPKWYPAHPEKPSRRVASKPKTRMEAYGFWGVGGVIRGVGRERFRDWGAVDEGGAVSAS
jgi:hypothetical protein